jgi:hypothetical protein
VPPLEVRLGPRLEPRVDDIACRGIHRIGDDVAEERELIPPALHVVVARGGVRKRVAEMQARPAAIGLQADRDRRRARCNRPSAGVTVSKHNALGRLHFDDCP